MPDDHTRATFSSYRAILEQLMADGQYQREQCHRRRQRDGWSPTLAAREAQWYGYVNAVGHMIDALDELDQTDKEAR